MIKRRFRVLIFLWSVCIVQIMIAPSAFSSTLVPRAKVIGDWEVSRVLLTKNTENATPPPPSGYARLIGLKFRVSPSGVTSNWSLNEHTIGIAKAEGRSLVLRSKVPLSIKALFEDEKVVRPKYFRGFVRGKASDYALSDQIDSLVNQSVTLYGYVLDRLQDANPGSVTFAAVGDVLIMEHDEGELLILRRPPKTRTAEHAIFCESARSDTEKLVCTDRGLWARFHYIQTTLPCALKRSVHPNSNLVEALRLIRQKALVQQQTGLCDDPKFNGSCVAVNLDAEANLIGSHMPATKMCVNGEYKDMPL